MICSRLCADPHGSDWVLATKTYINQKFRKHAKAV